MSSRIPIKSAGGPAPKRSSKALANSQELVKWAQYGRIIAGLIHEISTPLTSATLTLDQYDNQNTDDLVKQVRKDLRLLERYIMAARQQLKGESDPVYFSPVLAIRQVVRTLGARANEANTKVMVLGNVSPRLYGDPAKFRQIIGNLINNAIDACEANSSDEQKSVVLNLDLTKTALIIKVEDNGPGISPIFINQIFEPFYSTKSKFGRGTGVGLDMVKRYVEQDFSGTVRVVSRSNKGACFILTFPLIKLQIKPTLRQMC